ncbi:MAG: aspartate carbamoyltransferase regulatory subunit [Bacteroidia bacterium]|nr:MAG: aspartate carbamoyltransferase regulatory subunit [Bacteroidia bacterium]
MNKEKKNKLKVDPIKNGTVIDHITVGKALQVVDILNIGESDDEIMIGLNLSSGKMQKKDLIKIENRELSEEEADSIALISPTATLIIINDYQVVKKYKVEIPERVSGHIVCPNPACVTNTEELRTKFDLVQKAPVQVRCVYCEKRYEIDNVKFSF